MPFVTIELGSYEVVLIGKKSSSPSSERLLGRIFLKDTQGTWVARFDFKDNPGPPVQQASGWYQAQFPTHEFPYVIDVLRNEEPVYLRGWKLTDGSLSYVGISTGAEPVGEGEDADSI